MPDKPWWRRIDGVPPGFEGSAESRAQPWTSAQLRVVRLGVAAVIVIDVAIAAAASLTFFAILPVLMLGPQVYRWTPYQRRQFIGQRPPRKGT